MLRRPALIAVMLVAFAAEAAPDRETMRQAGRSFKEGDQAYNLGEYLKAIAAFEDAYRLSEDPIVLFNIAQSYRKQYGVDNDRGRLVKARDLYRTFLRQAADATMRSQAEGLLAEVEQLLAETERAVVAPPPPAPTPEVSAAPPALPPAALPRTDAEATESDEGAAGPTPWYKRTWVWVAAGVVAVAAGGGAFLATRGSSEPAGEFCPGGCKTVDVPVK